MVGNATIGRQAGKRHGDIIQVKKGMVNSDPCTRKPSKM